MMTEIGIRFDALLFILIITLIIITYLAWRLKYKAKAKERLLIIEKDYDTSKLLEKKKNAFNFLKTGIILLASSIGALIGFLVVINFALEINRGIIFFITVFMFAGIGMIVASKVDKSKEE
jgi:hypothetical protein